MKVFMFLCVLLPSFALKPSMMKCPNNKIGYFPKCDCEEENYGYSSRDRECRLMCPSISEGVFPNCTCRYGGAYESATNSCPNSECPKNTTSDSIYPKCECTRKNYEYNEYLNECYLVCPEDSSGHFPNCECNDELKGFNKELFQCMQCPDESTPDSRYPNCKNDHVFNATYDPVYNEFKVCHPGSYGIYPNCICKNGNVYYPDDVYHGHFFGWRKAGCVNCPLDLKGIFPNCECPDGEGFDGERCRACAWNGANGTYPNCECKGAAVYEPDSNECRECPSDSTGIYPNCTCKYPFYFRRDWNQCMKCPKDSTGMYPNCTCNSEKGGFVELWGECLDCPDNSTGRHPNCKCNTEGHGYNAQLRYCNRICEDGVSIHPFCKCKTFFKHYLETKTRKCIPFAYPGRPCPPNAIGTSPHCHCVQKDHVFIEYSWGCFKEYIIGGVSFSCNESKCSQLLSLYEVQPKAFFKSVE